MIRSYNKKGYIETKLGFRRHAPLETTEIVNTPIQGTAFHYLLYGLHEADERFIQEGMAARPIKQVHDEAEFHYPVEEREKVFEIVTESFEDLPWDWAQSPPVKISGKIGPNCYDLEDVNLSKAA
jgi:DNA polymerase I-like protein with 3'-5' exonuclease and polymerase domains